MHMVNTHLAWSGPVHMRRCAGLIHRALCSSVDHYLEQTVHTTHRELQAGAAGTRCGLLLVTRSCLGHSALGALACGPQRPIYLTATVYNRSRRGSTTAVVAPAHRHLPDRPFAPLPDMVAAGAEDECKRERAETFRSVGFLRLCGRFSKSWRMV